MKRNFLAVHLILFAVFLVLTSGSGTSQAGFVKLQLIDGDDPDLTVTFDVVEVGIGRLLYSFDAGNLWNSYSAPITADGGQVVNFALDTDGDSDPEVYEASLTYQNLIPSDRSQKPSVSYDYWRTVIMDWGSNTFRLDIAGTADVTDGYCPAPAPIPSSALLLGFGLLGLVGVRRRARNRKG